MSIAFLYVLYLCALLTQNDTNMKKIIFALCLLSSIVGLNSHIYAQKGTDKYLDEKKGFKCFKLGDPINGYLDKLEVDKAHPGNYFVNDSSLLSIGDEIKIKFIIVSTFNDSIYSINVFSSPIYKGKIMNILQAAYGLGTMPNRYIDKYRWMSDSVLLNFDCTDSRWCLFTFTDLHLQSQRESGKYKQASKATNDI